MDNITFVGLDVHKATVFVALAESGRDDGVRQVGVIENRSDVLIKSIPPAAAAFYDFGILTVSGARWPFGFRLALTASSTRA